MKNEMTKIDFTKKPSEVIEEIADKNFKTPFKTSAIFTYIKAILTYLDWLVEEIRK